MQSGPKPTTRGAQGSDLRQQVLMAQHIKKRKAEELQKFTKFMTALDEGRVAVIMPQIVRLPFNEKARFDQFAKEWNRKKLEQITSQFSAIEIVPEIKPEQGRPGFHRSPRMYFSPPGQPMDETQSVENPLPPDIHSTSPYLRS